MGRIRSIKPEFPQSETMGRVSRDARLLFVQLWTLADDSGRTRAHSRALASLLYPYDEDAPRLIDAWLDELAAVGCIRRYTVNGEAYLDIPNWLKHQKIDRASKPKYPGFDEASTNTREPSTSPREPSCLDQGSRIKDQGGEGIEEPEGKGEQVAATQQKPALELVPPSPGPNRRKRGNLAHFVPDTWSVSEAEYAWAIGEGYTPEHIRRETARFCDHEFATARSDWTRAWRNWITKNPPVTRSTPNATRR